MKKRLDTPPSDVYVELNINPSKENIAMNYTLYKILSGPKRFSRSTEYLSGVKAFVADYEDGTTTDLFAKAHSKSFEAGYISAQMRLMSKNIDLEFTACRMNEQAAGA